jgi:hypothetical protein
MPSVLDNQKECVERRIIGAPASWQGDPLRCRDCGELIGPKSRVVVIHEEPITVESVGCRCNRRPVLAKGEAQ